MKKLMKKLITVLLLVLAVIVSIPNNILADTFSKYAASRSKYSSTSDGIDVSYDKENNKIIYTIQENFDGEKAYFNITNDMKNILERIYMPGDDGEFQVEVINNSKYEYHYLNNSLTIDTLDFNNWFESDYATMGEDVWYSYTTDGENGKYIKGSAAFDSSILPARYTISRTANGALKALFKESTSGNYDGKKYLGCDVSVVPNGDAKCRYIMTDEVIGEELVLRGYENGIADLNKYYLDYYNKKYNTNVLRLEDLPREAILSIFGGNRHYNKETNTEVSALGYNWFYNACLYVAPISDSEGNAIVLDNTYTVGAYMRGENNVFEGVFEKDFASIASGSAASLREFGISVDARNTVNVFMDMDFGYMMSFTLEREKMGTLVINHVDEETNERLTEEEVSSGKIGEEYTTSSRDFMGYEYSYVDGEEVGEYIDGVIYVTYYYTKTIGSGDIEVMPPQTGVEVSTNYSNIVYYRKKEDYLKI